MTAKFEPPTIQDNPFGWGPNSIPEKFKDMPYQPFSKSDRLGKVRKKLEVYFHLRDLLFAGMSRLLTGLALRTQIAVTRISMRAKLVQEVPNMLTTTKKMKAPSSW